MSISERLKAWRATKELFQKDAANLLGMSSGVYQKYEMGISAPGAGALEAFYKAGINVNWLLSGNGNMLLKNMETSAPNPSSAIDSTLLPDFDLLPFYDIEASAGHGSFIDQEHKIGEMAFRKDWLMQKGLTANRCALLKARGDSMEPTIYDGDILLIDTSVPKIVDDSIYVLQFDHNLLVKRVQSTIPGGLVIISDNLRYPQQMIEPYYWEKVKIIGRVRWYGHEI